MSGLERIDVQMTGIGRVLTGRRLAVPLYQRPYAWTQEQVLDLFRDIADAINRRAGEYFLGTIVVTRSDAGPQTIIDGQQRLATASILIAAMRDYLIGHDDSERADRLQADYLSKKDLRTLEETPHLRLNDRDHDFYLSTILTRPGDQRRETVPTTPSQTRLKETFTLSQKQVEALTSLTHQPTDVLLDWLDYINDKVKVIVVEVADEANAFTIFEVLNDRGLDLSVSDLLKNFIFRLAADRVGEAQIAWMNMIAAIETVDGDEAVKTFIRHAWSSKNGVTRERELYDCIKAQVTSKQAAIDFANELAKKSVLYGALSNPGHEVWKPYGSEVVQSVEVFDLVKAGQIRPLLIALLAHFQQNEVRKALPMLVAWTVRFVICGSGGSGTLEAQYAERAKEITNGGIQTAAALWQAMKSVVPSDEVFADAFSRATVSKQYLARYYLRVLEAQKRGPSGSELVINPNEEKVTLEHIMPQTREPHWGHVSPDEHKANLKRLGNLTVLDKGLNEEAGNIPFVDKKRVFSRSLISLTKDLAEEVEWNASVIDRRQRMLADLAVKAWGAKPRQ